jgi:hypothetical protein
MQVSELVHATVACFFSHLPYIVYTLSTCPINLPREARKCDRMIDLIAALTRVRAPLLARNATFRRARMLAYGQLRSNVRTLVSDTDESRTQRRLISLLQGLGSPKETIRPADLPPSEVAVNANAKDTYVCSFSATKSRVYIPGKPTVMVMF